MNFNYNQEYQTLEITTDSGMTQSIRIPKQYLEKLYFMLWVELNEIQGNLGVELQEQNMPTENQ